jgi:hypothetical protein
MTVDHVDVVECSLQSSNLPMSGVAPCASNDQNASPALPKPTYNNTVVMMRYDSSVRALIKQGTGSCSDSTCRVAAAVV